MKEPRERKSCLILGVSVTYTIQQTHINVLIHVIAARKDFWNSVPAIADLCENHVPGLKIDKDVTEILEEGGVKLADVKALILSHWHFDHCMSCPSQAKLSLKV